MPAKEPDAWDLVLRPGPIDALTFLKALARTPADDFRSKLLRRDGLAALRSLWGEPVVAGRARHLKLTIDEPFINPSEDNGRGFSTLKGRVMDSVTSDLVMSLLREVGSRIRDEASIVIGGSVALLLESVLIRKTDDIDLVDEVPTPLRTEYALMDEMTRRYGLKLTHFQSHYLSEGWERRTISLGLFGQLNVRVADPLDVLSGKLFSRRSKDLDDLVATLPVVGKDAFREHVALNCDNFKRDEKSRTAGENNWYILTGEKALPSVAP